ncbi:MAG: flagellar assembly protein FliW [Gemmatimonadales bacterium]
MSAPAHIAPPTSLQVASRLFGPLSLALEDVIVMPEGMLGFAGERRFVLLPAAPEGIFWLQSVDDGTLIFLLVDPFKFFPDYVVDLPGIPDPGPGERVAVLSIVTLPRERGGACTANLQGPIVIQFPERHARQVVLADPRYQTRHELDLRAALK